MSVDQFPKNSQNVNASASPEVQMNENARSIDWAFAGAVDPDTTTGTTFGWLGGRWGGTAVAAGTAALTAEGSPTPTNYVVLNRATPAVSVSASATNWNNTAQYARIYKITTTASAILAVEDHRAGPSGLFGGPGPLVWNQQTDNYTLALTDAENAVAMNKATANNLTVPPNSTVAFPVGTSILIYQEGAGQTTIVPGSGVTIRSATQIGSPLPALALSAQFSLATLVKRATNEWILSGDLVTS